MKILTIILITSLFTACGKSSGSNFDSRLVGVWVLSSPACGANASITNYSESISIDSWSFFTDTSSPPTNTKTGQFTLVGNTLNSNLGLFTFTVDSTTLKLTINNCETSYTRTSPQL